MELEPFEWLARFVPVGLRSTVVEPSVPMSLFSDTNSVALVPNWDLKRRSTNIAVRNPFCTPLQRINPHGRSDSWLSNISHRSSGSQNRVRCGRSGYANAVAGSRSQRSQSGKNGELLSRPPLKAASPLQE